MYSRLLAIAALGWAFLYPPSTYALTVEQFTKICDSIPGECSDHPFAQAYIGGALDLLATLDENTDYLDKLYCREPKEIFDVSAIIRYMQTHGEGYATRNAMLLVVRYFEKNGGCQIEQ
ncbi:MAG TPA: hypothetical protein VIC08_16245 [Cellvibrionaceae bacterium]